MRRVFIAALVFGAWGLVTASGGSPVVANWEPEAGTTALLVEDHRAPVVVLRVEVPTGRWSRWSGATVALAGFEALDDDAERRFRVEADRSAADVQIIVGARSSVLEVVCSRGQWESVLEWVREMLRGRSVDRREVRLQGQGRRIDHRLSLRDPIFLARRAHAELLFESQDPRLRIYQPPPAPPGRAERLVEAREMLLRLPGRTIGFAGDLTIDEARAAASGLLPPVGDGAPEDTGPRLEELRDSEADAAADISLRKLTQVYFALGRDSIPLTDDDYPAFLVADHVLAGHFHSRMYEALRHETGQTYGVGSSAPLDTAPNLYLITSFTRLANRDTAERTMLEVLQRFHDEGIDEEERSTATDHLLGRRAFFRQSPRQLLARTMFERRLGLADGFVDHLPERAAALTTSQINVFIDRYFDPSTFRLVRVAPPEPR